MYPPLVEAAVRLAAQGHYHQFRKRNHGGEASDPLAVWGRFNAPKEKQLWYFRSTLEAVAQRLGDHPLVTELDGVVHRLGA